MKNTRFMDDLVAIRATVKKRLAQFEPVRRQISEQLHNNLNQFIQSNPGFVDALRHFEKVYPRLEPHLDNIQNALNNDAELDIANEVLTLAHIFDSIDAELDSANISLLSVIAGEKFHSSIVDFYKTLPLDQRREILIEEALLLHRLGHYAGSIFLLYGLIEGVITESFQQAKILTSKKGKLFNRDKQINGLGGKIQVGINNSRQLKSYFRRMNAYKLVAKGCNKTTIAATRNSILHGNSLDFNEEKRSAQLILWFYSVELNMKVILPVAL